MALDEPLELPAEFKFKRLSGLDREGFKMKTNSLKFCYSRLDPTQKSSLSTVFSDLFSGIQKSNTVYKRQGEGVISIEALRTQSRIDRIRAVSLQRPLWPSGACLPAGDGRAGEFAPAFTFVRNHPANFKSIN